MRRVVLILKRGFGDATVSAFDSFSRVEEFEVLVAFRRFVDLVASSELLKSCPLVSPCDVGAALGRFYGISQQHRDCHGTDTARYR